MKKNLKKIYALALAIVFLLGSFAPLKALAADPKVPTEGEVVELTEEELEAKRQAEIKAEWERQVKKYINKDPDQLTTAYLVGDYASGEILEARNIDDLVAIASTTKILSIYVVLDEIKAGHISLDDKVYIDKEISRLGGSSYKLKEGEEISVEDLIKAALIVSGNDATKALAKYLAGSEESFVEKMKAKLEELDIRNYQIINSSGLPNYNIDKQNMMTTRDLFYLSRSFIKDYPEMLEITSMKELVNLERDFKEENTNPLLGEFPQVDGLKTGYTGLAGRCLVATALIKGDEETTKDLRLISITMGSNSDAARYVAAKKLLKKSLDTYVYQTLANPNQVVASVEDDNLDPKEVNIYPKEEFSLLIKKSDFTNSTTQIDDLVPPLQAGQEVGTISYYLNGEEIFSTALIVKQDVLEASILRKIQGFYASLYMSLYKIFND